MRRSVSELGRFIGAQRPPPRVGSETAPTNDYKLREGRRQRHGGATIYASGYYRGNSGPEGNGGKSCVRFRNTAALKLCKFSEPGERRFLPVSNVHSPLTYRNLLILCVLLRPR